MLTYVINTSENKTFDSKKLFSFAGYHKIVWIDCLLSEVENYALEIYERQNALAATDFRVAVIVDFYSFDKIRKPYGTDGFSREEEGVDLAIYYPFIEAYLADNLFDKLSRMNLKVEQRDIYYVQSTDNDGFENISNAVEQIKTIFTPDLSTKGEISEKNLKMLEKAKCETKKVPTDINRIEQCVQAIIKALTKRKLSKNTDAESLEKKINEALDEQEVLEESIREKIENLGKKIIEAILEEDLQDGLPKEETERIVFEVLDKQKIVKDLDDKKRYTEKEIDEMTENLIPYEKYNLYCSENVTLTFKMTDYPYGGGVKVNFNDFYESLKLRNTNFSKIRRHLFFNSGSLTPIIAAFDTLTLSLYLIEMYETEASMHVEGKIQIDKIEPEKLKEVLTKSWNKVRKAREAAKENRSKYYDIVAVAEEEKQPIDLNAESQNIISLAEEDKKLERKKQRISASEDSLYQAVLAYEDYVGKELSGTDFEEFNRIMRKYLQDRDDTREIVFSREWELKCREGGYPTTTQCPSKMTYEAIIERKKTEISKIFKSALEAEFVSIDFEPEIKQAKTIYEKYSKLKEYCKMNLGSAIGLFIFVSFIMIIPFALLQRVFEGIFNLESIILYGLTFGITFGFLMIAYILQDRIIKSKIKNVKYQLQNCLDKCEQKKTEAFKKLKLRYSVELVNIEKIRHCIREVSFLESKNNIKNKHIRMHRAALEELENYLSSILNNLGVEPIIDEELDITSEFDVNKPIADISNKVYRIFDIETIEMLFDKKGGR